MRNAIRKAGDNYHPPRTITPITDRETAESFSAAVIDFSAGQLAQAARRSKDTAKRWKAARAAPSAASLINMCAALPTVRAWLMSEIERGERAAAAGSVDAVFAVLNGLAKTEGPEASVARAIVQALKGK